MTKPEPAPIPEISLEEYVAYEHSIVQKFVEWWKKNHAAQPLHFPMSMPIGHWDEQLHFFDPSDATVHEANEID